MTRARWRGTVWLVAQVLTISLASAALGADKSEKQKNEDLIEMGKSLLGDDEAPKRPPKRKRVDASQKPAASKQPTPPPVAAPAQPVAATPAQPVAATPAQPVAATPAQPVAAAAQPVAAVPVAPIAKVDAAPTIDLLAPPSEADAAPELVASSPSPLASPIASPQSPFLDVTPPPPADPPAPVVMTAKERVRRGRNYPMQGTAQSPLARFIPPKLVPAAATAVVVGTMASWPFLMKTLTGLLKKLLAGFLKKRAKKDKKLEPPTVEYVVLGFRVRPTELAALLVGALVYGLAICYALKGWKIESRFVLSQELLVVAIAYSRSFVRFLYERLVGLSTQFKFWPGGALLCLGSAYLGNTLGTVGYEVEAAKGKEQQVLKMKSWLVVVALGMALGFFAANLLHPDKILQSGRVITSGMALGDIMPVAPMAGQKIYQWRRGIWGLLFALVVPTYFAINFLL